MRFTCQVIPFLLVLLVGTGVARRHSRKTDSPLKDWQKQFLERIQVAAREGGLPESEVKDITKFDKDVCYDRPCLESALEVLQATNFTVDPCKPYMWFEYVCARRVNGVDNINQPERIMSKVSRETVDILEKGLPNGQGDEYMLKEAQVYYYQCKNKAKNDKEDVKEILDMLSENYGEWPMIKNREPGPKFNWLNMVADVNRIERKGSEPLLLKVFIKIGNTGPVIALEPGKTSFSNSAQDFTAMLTSVQKFSGKNRPARIEQLEDMVRFHNSITAEATRWNPKDYPEELTIAELQNQTDKFIVKKRLSQLQINWMEFFQRVFQGSDIEITDESPKVFVNFRQLMRMVQEIERHPKIAVSNALNFNLATILLQETTTLLDDLNTFKCTEEAGTRDEICYTRTIENFGYTLGNTYLSVHFNADVETPAIKHLMTKIQDGYINVIKSYDWMEDSTKDFLEDKIRSIQLYVGAAPLANDPEKLQEFYSGIQASQDKTSSYPRNYLHVTSWATAKKRAWAYRNRRNYDIYEIEWNHWSATVNAQYHKLANQARVIGGIAQAPLFAANRPGFMNYGGLGMVLGHEIGHSFDTLGRRFNKDGELGEYWDKASLKRYVEWVQKIIDDYGSEAHQTSETSAETVDGSKTVDENISDILGIHISFLSYQEYLKELEKKGKRDKILPGLKNVTPQKLFYMKYANMWCDKKDVQAQFNDMLGDHSPGNIRATVPLKRSKQFAETFGCPLPEPYK